MESYTSISKDDVHYMHRLEQSQFRKSLIYCPLGMAIAIGTICLPESARDIAYGLTLALGMWGMNCLGTATGLKVARRRISRAQELEVLSQTTKE